jgi:hypothetical protein
VVDARVERKEAHSNLDTMPLATPLLNRLSRNRFGFSLRGGVGRGGAANDRHGIALNHRQRRERACVRSERRKICAVNDGGGACAHNKRAVRDKLHWSRCAAVVRR